MRTLADTDHKTVGVDIDRSPYALGGDRSSIALLSSNASEVWMPYCTRPGCTNSSPATRGSNSSTPIYRYSESAEGSGSSRRESLWYTSTTSVFGHVLTPPAGAPAAWITADVVAVPKTIYGITKLAAENVCE